MTHECLAKSKVKCNFIYVVRYIKVPHQVSLCMCIKYLALIHNKMEVGGLKILIKYMVYKNFKNSIIMLKMGLYPKHYIS